MTSFIYKIRDLAPLGYLLIKTKALTLFWDESYHNTSIYHINKKKYNTSVQLTY